MNGVSFLEFTPEIYLQLLEEGLERMYGSRAWPPWELATNPKETELKKAKDMLTEGGWGKNRFDLPWYTQILGDFEGFREERKRELQTRGTEIVPGKVLAYSDAAGNVSYYHPTRLTQIAPEVVGKQMRDYFAVEKDTMSEAQRLNYQLALRRIKLEEQEYKLQQHKLRAAKKTAEFTRMKLPERMRELQETEQRLTKATEQRRWISQEEMRESVEREFAREWESARMLEMSRRIEEPSDWIRRWEIQNRQNPFRSTRREFAGGVSALQQKSEEGTYWISQAREELEGALRERTTERDLPSEQWEKDVLGATKRARAVMDARHTLEELETEYGTAVSKQSALAARTDIPESGIWEGGHYGKTPIAQKIIPPLPEWLSKSISERRVREKRTEERYAMIPREPRGAGVQRWQPARQWG